MRNSGRGRSILLIIIVIHRHLLVLIRDAGHTGNQLVPFRLLSDLRLHGPMCRLCHLFRTLILPHVLLRCCRFCRHCRRGPSSFCLLLVLHHLSIICPLASGCRASVTLRFDLANGVDLLRVNLLDVLRKLGVIVTGALIVYRFLVQLNAFSDGNTQGKRLVVLLKSTIFPRIEHLLISIPLLREQAFENVVCSFFIYILTTDRVYASRVRARTWVKAHKSLPSRLVWQSESARIESRLFELGLLNNRFAEKVHVLSSSCFR